jgi:hypothetical protein
MMVSRLVLYAMVVLTVGLLIFDLSCAYKQNKGGVKPTLCVDSDHALGVAFPLPRFTTEITLRDACSTGFGLRTKPLSSKKSRKDRSPFSAKSKVRRLSSLLGITRFTQRLKVVRPTCATFADGNYVIHC